MSGFNTQFSTPGPPAIPGAGGGGGGAVLDYITSPTVIANITNAANWDQNGAYIGPLAGLTAGKVYIDEAAGLRYEYDGGALSRHGVNEIF